MVDNPRISASPKVVPTAGMVFIPKETWEKPNGVPRAVAHQISYADALRIAKESTANDTDAAIRLRSILGNYPNMSSDMAVGFSKLGLDASHPAVANAAHYDTLAQQVQGYDGGKGANYADIAQALDVIGKKPDNADIKDHNDARWFSGFKGMTRTITSALFAPLQTVTQYARIYARNIEQAKAGNRDWFTAVNPLQPLANKSLLTNTIFYQAQFNKQNTGEGYFPGYKSDAVQASEQIAKNTLTIKGTNDMAWTIGRGAADLFFDPEETGFKTMSGIVDATIALIGDPVVRVSKFLETRKLEGLKNAAVAATKSSRVAMADAAYIDRATKRVEEAKHLLAESDKHVQEMKQSYFNDLVALHDANVAGKGTMPMDEAIARGDKLGIPVLRDDYNKTAEELHNLRAIEKAKDPVAEAKASGMRFKKDATDDEILKSIKRRIKDTSRANRATRDKITEHMSTVYADDLAPQKALLEEAKRHYIESEAFATRLSKQLDNAEEARKIVEDYRAGIKVTPDDARFERGKAVEWFAGPRAQHFLGAIADIDNAAEINRLSKGKFGAELSADLARAKTVQEVEDAILPALGISLNSMLPASTLGRYVVSQFPMLRLRGANSERLNKVYDTLSQALGHPLQRMPNGRYVHFEDTEGFVQQTTRWMASARFKQNEIDDVFNRIVATDPNDIVSRRNIALDVLNNVLIRTADDAGLSKISKNRISESLTAYRNALKGEGKFHSEVVGEQSGFKIILDRGVEIDLTGIPNSMAQLSHGIRLPNIDEIRRSTGRIARAARAIDKKVGNGTMTEDAARQAMKFVRGANNIFKTSMLVFRPAFIARDIMECMIRQYISGGKNIISNPRQMLATIISNPVGSRSLLAKANNKLLQKYDNFLVDVNGNAFHAQGYQAGIDQEHMFSSTRMLQERAVSSDARVLTHGIRPNGEWKLEALNEGARNITMYSDALAGQILRDYADPIRRTIASRKLPGDIQRSVDAGKLSFEDAVSRMVKENRFPGMDMLRNSTDEMKRILSTDKGRKAFLFEHDNSISNQVSYNTLGMKTLEDFIGTGKIVDDKGKVLFEIGADFAYNHKKLSSIIKKQLIENDAFAERAKQVRIPMMTASADSKEVMRKLIDGFFEIGARATTRFIYSPEYRVKYWESAADIAELMTKETAQKILATSFAKEISATKVVTIADDGTKKIVNYAEHNPMIKKLQEVAEGKHPGGFLSVDEVNQIASERAYKHVANLFYDAAERNNMTQAASLAMPFVNAWQNTIRTWGKYSLSPARMAQRVMPASRLLQTLQSPASRAIYEATGTGTPSTDPSEGFIYSGQNGQKQFTVPFTGGLVTAFGLLGDPHMANISMSLQSLNLAFSGGSLPGSDVGIAPGVGPLVTFMYKHGIPQSLKYAMPPVVRDIIEPYGPNKTASFLEDFAPGWLKNFLFATDNANVAKFSKGIMGWYASTDPKYSALYDQQTTLSAGERTSLQNELAEKAGHMAIGQIMWQSFIKALSPGAPIYSWYQKAKGGQSFSQIQMANAFKTIYDQVGDYNVAFGQFSEIFGPQAIMSMVSTSTAEIMGSSAAYNFATSNPDLLDKYVAEIPYFFTGGDYSAHYAALMRARGKNVGLSRDDIIREADGAMIAAMRGQLLIKAARYGYGPDWVDQQMSNQKAELFPNYEPLRPKTSNDRKNRIARVIEMSSDPRILQTDAGKGLQQWLPQYMSVRQQALDAGYKSIGVDAFIAERQSLDEQAQQIGSTNPDFRNLYNRVFYYDING